ncbi:UBC-like protein [Rhizopus microsporus var. microsporus]|uniref:UBC-like protein n=1 Tax=Rhizopus microsporus var. microsporus TaxID=86635 RepID=A0A1X0QYJ7_RHIZD|nr:UBC-like protein [Rhizopus microsporus var. microsporus]
MTSLYSKRLTKELRDLQKNPPEGVEVEEASNFLKWTLCLTGARGSVYEGEKFKLEFRFTPQYPLEAPEVVFIRPYVPIHPQLVTGTNGGTCLLVNHLHDVKLTKKKRETG